MIIRATIGMKRAANRAALRVVASAIVLVLLSVALVARVDAQVSWSPVTNGLPRTAAELSDFAMHTGHAQMWAYLEALRDASTDMRLGTYGQTWEGRDLAYAVFSRPAVREPSQASALDRPIVLLAANVHGDERTFREGLLVLMRDFATPGTEAYELLDDVTVVVAPEINPDGSEAGVLGTRGNAWGVDLNRDYVKLEQSAIAHYVGNLIREWRPHLFVDGHDGGARPYNLNYQCPSHVDTALEITLLCDQEIFPAIDAKLASEGYTSWYYTMGDETEWRVGGSLARIGRNYGGFVNSVGILIEAPAQPLEVGARAGYLGYLAIVQFAAQHADRLIAVVAEARAETIEMGAAPRGDVTVEMMYDAEDYPVSYQLVPSGGRGTDPDQPVESVLITGARLMKKPVATKKRARPWAYLLPRFAVDAVAMLRRHGIAVERLTEPAELRVDAYTVAGVTHEQAFNHAATTVIEVGEVVTGERLFPTGTYVVPTAQALGRLVAHMLEVETRDNVVYWNTMDEWIPRSTFVPIFKLMTPTPLSTSQLGG
jgi:hypothetical protein